MLVRKHWSIGKENKTIFAIMTCLSAGLKYEGPKTISAKSKGSTVPRQPKDIKTHFHICSTATDGADLLSGKIIFRTNSADCISSARRSIDKIAIRFSWLRIFVPKKSPKIKKCRYCRHLVHYGAPMAIRTPDLRLRRPLLYPAELWAHIALAPHKYTFARASEQP